MSDGGRGSNGRFTAGNKFGKGRDPGPSLTEILEEELERIEVEEKDGKGQPTGRRLNGKHLLAKKMIRAALADLLPGRINVSAEVSQRAAEAIYNRIEGRPAETLTVKGAMQRLNIGVIPLTRDQLAEVAEVKMFEAPPELPAHPSDGNGNGKKPPGPPSDRDPGWLGT